jgi:hypothetical protein
MIAYRRPENGQPLMLPISGTPLLLLGRFFLGSDRALGSLEAHLGMHAITEWLFGRRAAATKGNGWLALKVPLVAVGIDQLDGTLDAEWPVRAYGNLHFSFWHRLLLKSLATPRVYCERTPSKIDTIAFQAAILTFGGGIRAVKALSDVPFVWLTYTFE